jgi:RNA polymerase-binding transcription factor DksA
MSRREQERYRRILSRFSQAGYVRKVNEPLRFTDWEESAAELHDRYVAGVDEEIRWQIREAALRALERMRAGEFGRCSDCGAPIAPRRLAAVPWTERCVACQASRERGAPLSEAAAGGAAIERKAA